METKREETPKGCVVALMVPYLLFFVFGSIIFQGVAIHKIWQWFVVPKFNAPSIGVAEAIGLSIMLSLLMPMSSPTAEAGVPSWRKVLYALSPIIRPAMALLIAYIAKQFVS